MDAFFASIEQAINPRLKGRPVIVGSRGNKLHTVVCAASYEAKALGIDSGMPTEEAFKICPKAEFVAADQSKYIWTSEQIFELLKGYDLELVYASIDEFQMDIAETPEPLKLAENIRKQIYENFNITASVGIAKNWLLAKLASKLNKPNGIAIINPDNLEEILSRTPVKKLCGVGEKTSLFFEGLGIKTCLDLYRKSAQFLQEKLGQNGLNLYLALHSSERFNPAAEETKAKSVGHSYTLPRASENTGFIQAWIRLLSEMVARRLRQQNLSAKTIHLWLSGPEMPHFGAQKTYKEPTDNGYEIYHRSLKIMAKIGSKGLPADRKMPKIRALGITCSSLFQANYPPLFPAQKSREDLTKAVDSINNKYGEWSIYPAVITLSRKIS
jgi:DNA polymerase-4